MIAFDFSNATETPCRAAIQASSGYAGRHNSRNDDGGWLSAGTPIPAFSEPPPCRTGERNELSSICSPSGDHQTTFGVKTVIQPARRVFSVPGIKVRTSVDAPNQCDFSRSCTLCPSRSTQRDGFLGVQR